MQQKLNDASQRPLDETILIQYQNALIQQSLNDSDIEEKVDKLQQYFTAQVKRLDSHMDYRKTKIIEQAEACLLVHSKDDTYVKTEDVKQCYEILERYNVLVIFAKAGGGKSKTSLQIAKMYQEKMYTPMLFINDEIVRNRDLINFNDKNIVIVEDLFGRSNIDFNEHLHRGLLDIFYSCIKNESCKTKLIITIRGSVEITRKLIEKHKIFENHLIIDLEKSRTLQCNMIILSKYMKIYGISLCECKQIEINFPPPVVVKQCRADVLKNNDFSMTLCVSFCYDICTGIYETEIGFPQACQLFCSNNKFTEQGMVYFTHTSQSLVKEMNYLKSSGFDKRQTQYQYCVLVYTAIKRSIYLDNFDEKLFLQILSSVYDESPKVKITLIKAAVLVLEGTYLSKKYAISNNEQTHRLKASEMYVLRNTTINEAALISYSEDADVLTLCDLGFLLKYIRPEGYIDDLSENMVLMYTYYKPLVKRLIRIISDDRTNIDVGFYLQLVWFIHRRDEIIEFFFQNIGNVKPEQYTRLIYGLTSFGENRMLVQFHPKLCKQIMSHAGLKVFLSFCRPLGLVDNATIFVEMETDSLIKTLFKFLSRLPEDDQKSNIRKYERWFLFQELGLVNDQYAVGNYVFEILIANGFANIVELFLTNLKQNIIQIDPMDIKEFLDGLLNKGERSSIVSQFKTFFEAVLFKYESIPSIVRLCRPLSTLSSQNIIKVDEKSLEEKLYDYFESSAGIDYVSKNGFLSTNNKFVRMMYEQFVSYDDETIPDEESDDADLEKSTDEATNQENAADNCDVNGKKIVFDDYPGDAFRVNADGMITGSLKQLFVYPMDGSTFNSRLYKFLSYSEFQSIRRRAPATLMELLNLRFKTLLYGVFLDWNYENSDELDHCEDSKSDYGYWCA